MDNSFGSRPPWPGRPDGHTGQSFGNLQPGMTMGYRADQPLQMRAPMMNGYTGPMAGVSTPSTLGGGGYPMWDMDIPSQMFMQAVNFDRLMQQQVAADPNGSISVTSGPSRSSDDTSFRSDAGRDLIEQQQAVEQARLLQRFKELRQWQQQQQEMLMSQQHQQLSLLRKEQERMQGMISKQRENQWGGGHPNYYANTETPPRREVPPGTDMSKILAPPVQQNTGTEGQHVLPKPVMYVQPKDDDDEIKTNPDLFSDTNSNRGSQAGIDDGMFPIPDSASEASVEVGIHQMRQGQVKNFSELRHRLNPHELDAPRKLHRSFAELEHDAEFLNLSSQSPTMLEMQHGKKLETRSEKIEEEGSEHSDGNKSEDRSDDSQSDDDDDDDDDEDEDDSSDDQEDTQIEVKETRNIDELPIKPGVEGGKTFEQLLEEQLKAEEERLKEANASNDSPSQPKRTFLKKGEGIARFESKPGQRPPRNKKKTLGSQISTQATSKPAPQKNTTDSVQSKHISKVQGKPPAQSKSSNQPSKKPTGQSTKHKKQDDKSKKAVQKSPVRDSGKHTKSQDASTDGNKPGKSSIRKRESFPDDASFVANLKERQKESERDLEELDEFEILEQFADNMSFCSNSSIVTKGLRGLQNDRILTGVVSKTQEVGRPTSPRAALIKKLEQEKHAKHKHQLEQPSNIKHGVGQANMADSNVTDKKEDERLKHDGRHKAVPEDNGRKPGVAASGKKDVDNNDEYESVSESSDDSSSDDDDDGGDNDKNVKNVLTKLHSDLSQGLGKTSWHEHSKGKSKNDSVCSTDRKLERVLSYTGFTESSSVSQTSESEQEVDSDDDDEFDFSAGGYGAKENKEPLKTLTRKVAGREDRNKFPFQNLPTDKDLFQTSLNTSAFAPKAKSPIVISKEKISKPDTKSSFKQDVSQEETKFSYHSDSDSVGKKQNDSFSEEDDSESNDGERKSRKSFGEKKTLQFDDDEEWGDLTPKVLKSRRRKESESEHDKTLVEESETVHIKIELAEKESEDTPPTSKLVSKLFPSLKPAQKKQEEQNLEKIQSVSQANTGDGVQSKILRDKLMELEREIEKFRNENKHLATLRTEREQGLTVLKKEIAEFEKEKALELKRIEEFRNEEMKKLKHEKKMFEKYQKAARAGPDKKEREEIENLRSQLSDLQEELKRKESRWTANNSRLRDKIDQLEQENEELKEEIKLLEKKRLEWMQKDQKSKTRPGGAQMLLRSSTPTEELEQLANGDMDHGFNDLSASTTLRSNSSLKASQQQPKVNIRSSFPPPNKQTSHSQHQSAQNKPVNVNQSVKSNVSQSGAKVNQSKKIVNHNSKPGHSGHAQSQGNKPGQKTHGKSNSSLLSGKSSNSSESKNILRNSLAEDLPRRELGTIAEPQDMSIYSEADADSVPAPSNLPRKFAPRPGVDKSVIDKGDNDEYDEIQHSDGKVERTYKNGAREILFSNGTRKEISADGKSIVVSFFNGDMKQIMPDQRVIYYYAENQTTHTNYPDGLEIIQFPNQQTEKLYPDGTKEITFPDQTIKYIFPNGSEESIFPDGTVIRLEKNGDKTMEFPNGQREIHTQEYKRREYPDGTVKTVYPDGRQETRYSNGRLRVKDKDGNVIIDRQC